MSLANIKATSDLAPREPSLFDPVGKFHRSQPTRHICLLDNGIFGGMRDVRHGALIALIQTGVKSMARLKRGKSAARAIDHRVGSRIRKRRIKLGLTQRQFAEMIGVSHQQVQKYERGIDRVSAGRLFEIGGALSVPIADFFEDIGQKDPRPVTPHWRMLLEVVRNVAEIRSEKQQEAVSELVRALASA